MSRRHPFCLALAFAFGVALFPGVLRAAPGDATRLEYARSERASVCPDRDTLKRAVTERLGYDPFFPAARQTIVVEITDSDAGLRAQMRLVDDNGMIVGSRELHESVEHCDDLVASLALAISIALDPSAALGGEPEVPSMAPTRQAAPNSTDDSQSDADAKAAVTPAPAAKTHPEKPTHAPRDVPAAHSIPIAFRAAGFGALGVAPATAFGVRLGVSFGWRWFRLVTEFADQLPASRAADGGGRAKASLLAGSLAPCFVQAPFAACARLDVGALRTEGTGIADPSKQSSAYVALGGRLEYSPIIAGKLHLLVNADVLRSLTPVTLRLRGEQVWKTPALSLAGGLGLEVQFP